MDSFKLTIEFFFINLLVYTVKQWLILDHMAIRSIPKLINSSDLDIGAHKVKKLKQNGSLFFFFIVLQISRDW